MKNRAIYKIGVTRVVWCFSMIAAFSCARNDDGYLRPHEIDETLLPEVDFTASSTDIRQNDLVTFTDQSTGDPSLYSWTFEGGNPTKSTEVSPEVEYPVPGTFKVGLKVRNAHGASELIKEAYITVSGEQLDPDIVVRMNFENSLLNEGSIGGEGVSIAGPAYGTGVIGDAAYTFDGTNALSIPGYTGINGAGARTVSAWVKTTATVRSTITHWGAQATGGRASFVLNPNGTLRFEAAGGGINGITPANDGEWHHVAYTFDGSKVTLFVDGLTDAVWETDIINTGVAGETDVEIGAQLGSNIFNGDMDDVRVYAKSLSPGEVGILASNPLLTIKMNFEDSLLNEGTIGGEGVSLGSPIYGTGVVDDGAYTFDGTNPVSFPGYTGIDGAGARTVGAWVKTTATVRSTVTHWGIQATGGRASFVLNPDGTLRFEVAGGGINGVTPANDGEWHHVGYTFDGAIVTLYLDGVADASWETAIINTGVGGESDVEIGAQIGANIFNGDMDDVRVYQTSLSPETMLFLSQR